MLPRALRGQETEPSLGRLASQKGILFGSVCLARELDSDPAYAGLLGRECRVIVPGIELKWAPLRPRPDQFDFSRADMVIRFAESIGALVRGHTLVWHETLPQWLPSTMEGPAARALLARHIAVVCGRYRNRIHSWDVVNEAVEPDDGRADGLRVTPWLRAMGPGYIAEAFRMAAEADPSAILTYNDDGICDSSRSAVAKRQAVQRLLDQLGSAGAPVQALGMQAHLTTAMEFRGPELRRFLDDLQGRGLKVMITELDVLDRRAGQDPSGQDQRVADTYRRFLDVVLAHRATVACVAWGMSDRHSWLRLVDWKTSGDLRPHPYDEELRRKAAWSAIYRSLENAPTRS
nr:endo-1,4-beta-xylanase [Rhodoplanes roseus]